MQGHIHKRVRQTKAGVTTTWWYVVLDVGRTAEGRRRQKWYGGFRTRKEADAARAKLIHEMNIGQFVMPTRLTYREWVEERWLPLMRTQVRESTWEGYRRNMANHVLPRIGHIGVQKLVSAQLNALYADLITDGRVGKPGGLSARTVSYIHGMVHKSLADAVDGGVVVANVAARARPPKGSGEVVEMRFWTPEQLGVFLGSVEGHRLEALFWVAALTGMRRGEVLGLRWQDVDLEDSRLSVRQAVVAARGGVRVVPPKNGKARVIDVDGGTVERLVAHRGRQEGERLEWGSDYEESGLVFARENGSPLSPFGLSELFVRLSLEAGLPRNRFHDLRHTHATVALRAGVNVKVIAERLGHYSAGFTLKQYAHVIPGMQAEAAAKVAELVGVG